MWEHFSTAFLSFLNSPVVRDGGLLSACIHDLGETFSHRPTAMDPSTSLNVTLADSSVMQPHWGCQTPYQRHCFCFIFLFQETDILTPHIHLSLNKCFDYIQVRAQQKLLGLR